MIAPSHGKVVRKKRREEEEDEEGEEERTLGQRKDKQKKLLLVIVVKLRKCMRNKYNEEEKTKIKGGQTKVMHVLMRPNIPQSDEEMVQFEEIANICHFGQEMSPSIASLSSSSSSSPTSPPPPLATTTTSTASIKETTAPAATYGTLKRMRKFKRRWTDAIAVDFVDKKNCHRRDSRTSNPPESSSQKEPDNVFARINTLYNFPPLASSNTDTDANTNASTSTSSCSSANMPEVQENMQARAMPQIDLGDARSKTRQERSNISSSSNNNMEEEQQHEEEEEEEEEEEGEEDEQDLESRSMKLNHSDANRPNLSPFSSFASLADSQDHSSSLPTPASASAPALSSGLHRHDTYSQKCCLSPRCKRNLDEEEKEDEEEEEDDDDDDEEEEDDDDKGWEIVNHNFAKANKLNETENSKNITRVVRFDQSSKTWDGPMEINQKLDDLVQTFFAKLKPISESDVIELADHCVHNLKGLEARINDLGHRLSLLAPDNDNSETVPVLPEGGGSGIKLLKTHLPFLRALHMVIQSACRRVTDTPSSTITTSDLTPNETKAEAEARVEAEAA